MRRAIVGVLVTAAATLPPAGSALGQTESTSPPSTEPPVEGVGVSPGEIKLTDTLRGETYGTSLLLFNYFDGDRAFVFDAEGAIAPWVRFSSIEDPSTPIDRLVVGQRTSKSVRIDVAVPADVANDTYTGTIGVLAEGADGSTAEDSDLVVGAAVSLQVDVNGTQRLAGRLVEAFVTDAEVGRAVNVYARVSNEGNVGLEPELSARLVRQGVEVATVSNEARLERVDAGAASNVAIAWDTSDALPGDYTVEVTGAARGLDLGAVSATFHLSQAGALQRSGSLERLEVVGDVPEGGDALVRGVFSNTSKVEVVARLTTELYLDGEKVDTEISDGQPVAAGQPATLGLTMRGLGVGSYRLVGFVEFEGRGTEPKEVRFDVRPAASTATSDDDPPVALMAAGGAAAAAAVGLGLLAKRRRTRPQPAARR